MERLVFMASRQRNITRLHLCVHNYIVKSSASVRKWQSYI